MLPYGFRFYVEVHLAEEIHASVVLFDHFLIEGVPVRHLAAVRKRDHKNRQTRLAEEHVFYKFRVGLYIAVLSHFAMTIPESIPVYEEIPVFGLPAVFKKVSELRRTH